MAKIKKQSLANLLRNHVNQKLKENFDYTLALNRKQDILNFIELNKSQIDKNSNAISIRPSHTRALEECLKNKGIDPQTLGKSKRTPKFSGDLNAVITPEPQAGAVDSTGKIKLQAGTTAGVQVTPTGVIVQPPPMIFDEKSVSATLSAFFLMFRLAYPDLELLTEDEKESLGKVWLPAFNKYMTENWAIIGVPLLATFGIFIPKIVEARKKKKIRQSKGEGLEKQKETDSKLEERAKEIKEEAEKKIKMQVESNQNLPPAPPIGQVSTELTYPEKKNE